MALILLRHAEPKIEAGICYGRLDIEAHELSETHFADVLHDLPAGISRIETSPLRRCFTLAKRLADRLHLPLAKDARLQEIDFGHWEGVPWDDVPRAEVDEWAADLTGARPHGGESVDQVTRRVGSYCFERMGSKETVLAVTHLGVVRCAYHALGHRGALDMKLGYARSVALSAKGTL